MGLVSIGHTNAYVLGLGAFEASWHSVSVNDTVDFLDLRKEILSGNSQLTGNTGDLTGNGKELRLGVGGGIELFYRESAQALTLNLAPVSSADIENLDNELSTRRKSYGFKWLFYDAVLQDLARPWSSVALQVTRSENRSDDFGGDLAGLRTSASGGVLFDPASRFALDRLQDNGWQARLVYSAAWSTDITTTLWAGYGSTQASSGTSWDVDIAFLRDALFQSFDSQQSTYMLGASVNWHLRPRLPVQFGYEYLAIRTSYEHPITGNSSFSRYIPSFLRGDNLSRGDSKNHTVYGKASWWITPHLYIQAGGRLFSDQFNGLMPHYNNALSGGFANLPYGYAELSMGIKVP